jgi:NAD(P)-dependent dehydrogenase (short-subunit alcohol dehydrogenase family)
MISRRIFAHAASARESHAAASVDLAGVAMTGSIDFSGRAAIVTGGGRGLGRAFAQALAAAGSSVAVIARSAGELAETVRLVEQSGGQARAFTADVTDERAVDNVFAEIEQSLGAVDLLVNNAGIAGPIGPFAQSRVEDWWRTIEVNLRGQILCAHRALPGMIARRRGRIVNIASGGGATMLPYFSAYVTSKTALIRFSECFAAEVKAHGLAVFAMGPGTVRTAMAEYSLNSPEGRTWLPWFREIFDEGRDLPPERPAALLLALASGTADLLSGCFFRPEDDLEAIVAAAETVKQRKLHSLQVGRF